MTLMLHFYETVTIFALMLTESKNYTVRF
ncbi:hypothetical protein PCC21_039430 [Pectobacterium carotovorum subsp. carotovorum PCC21]|nr:hypothetical protein PCC21_039430 [Pectobacterium carotovorum subsp. carotovorum PCC21]